MAISDQNMQRWLPQQGGGSPGPQMGARDVLALLTGGGGNSVYMGNRGMQGQGFAKPLQMQMQPMPQPMMPQPMQGEQPMQARGGGGHGGGAQSTALARLLMQMSQQRPEMPMTYTF